MDNDRKFIIQLRDCFNAGYQMPQYCIDNNIKKPLFVGTDESQKDFLWEIYTQFKYTNSSVPITFALQNVEADSKINFAFEVTIAPLLIKNFSALNLNDYDKIIFLTSSKTDTQTDKFIYLNELCNYFFNRAYCDIPLLHFAQKNPGVKVIQINIPILKYNKNLSDYEKKLLSSKTPESYHVMHLRPKLIKAQRKGKIISTPYDLLGYSNQKVLTLLTNTGITHNEDGSDSLNDNASVGIKDGKRITANQPSDYKNKIVFVGNCVYYGYGVPYDRTIESQLQKILNEHNLPYKVENAAQFIAFRQQSVFYTLNAIQFHPGDIVFVYLDTFKFGCEHIPFWNIQSILDRPHDYGEVFADTAGHTNENGHRALAEKFFDYLTENDFFNHTNFEYPPPCLYLIVMVYRKKISQAQQNFCRTRSWTTTKQSCVTGGLRLAA